MAKIGEGWEPGIMLKAVGWRAECPSFAVREDGWEGDGGGSGFAWVLFSRLRLLPYSTSVHNSTKLPHIYTKRCSHLNRGACA